MGEAEARGGCRTGDVGLAGKGGCRAARQSSFFRNYPEVPGTTATVVTQGSHGLVTNAIATIGGANETAYNGSFAVTVVNGTTFTYTTNGTPSATPATGTPVFRAGAADFTGPTVIFLIDRRPPNTTP